MGAVDDRLESLDLLDPSKVDALPLRSLLHDDLREPLDADLRSPPGFSGTTGKSSPGNRKIGLPGTAPEV